MKGKFWKGMALAVLCATCLTTQQAEAGVPTGKTPMQAYAHAYTKCYYSANGQEHGYISAEADLIKMDQIRSDGWAHGSYPAGSRRVSRWFKLDTIVGDLNFSNYQTSLKSNCTVYRTPNSGQTIGTAYNDEDVTVVSVSGSRTQIVYHLSGGGYKMGWVDSGYVNSRGGDSGRTEVNNNTINTNPIIKTVSRETTSSSAQSGSTAQTGRINTKANTFKNPNLSGYAGYVTAGSEVTIHEESGNACKITYYNDYGKARTLWVAASAVTKNTAGSNANVVVNDVSKRISPSGYYYPLGEKSYFKNSNGVNKNRNHDCMKEEGTPVYAICDGTATFKQVMGTYKGKYTMVSYGNVIYLEGKNVEARYAHLSRFSGVELIYDGAQNFGSTYTVVSNRKAILVGERQVKAGELIGYVGTTGHSSDPHLHFEIYVNNVRKEPNEYFYK